MQCLVYNELPFSEDVRQFTFSSLPVKDTTDANKKHEPTEEQCTLLDQLITDMDLSLADTCVPLCFRVVYLAACFKHTVIAR